MLISTFCTSGYPRCWVSTLATSGKRSSLCWQRVEQVLAREQGSSACQNFSARAISFGGSPAPGGGSSLMHVRLSSSWMLNTLFPAFGIAKL